MKLFHNKSFVLFLILAIVAFTFPKVANAGGVLDFIKTIVFVVATIAALVFVPLPWYVIIPGMLGLNVVTSVIMGGNIGDIIAGPLGGGIACLFGSSGSYWSDCGGGSPTFLGAGQINACGSTGGFSIPVTFYNFQMNTNYHTVYTGS